MAKQSKTSQRSSGTRKPLKTETKLSDAVTQIDVGTSVNVVRNAPDPIETGTRLYSEFKAIGEAETTCMDSMRNTYENDPNALEAFAHMYALGHADTLIHPEFIEQRERKGKSAQSAAQWKIGAKINMNLQRMSFKPATTDFPNGSVLRVVRGKLDDGTTGHVCVRKGLKAPAPRPEGNRPKVDDDMPRAITINEILAWIGDTAKGAYAAGKGDKADAILLRITNKFTEGKAIGEAKRAGEISK